MSDLVQLLEQCAQVARNPKAQLDTYLAQGKKVVGCMPIYCPEELVHAAGMVPFGIWGAEREISEAKKYFPAFYCSIAQTCLEMGLRGELNQLTAVLIPVLCDTLKCLGQNWKAGVQAVPFIPVVHPQNRKLEAGIAFQKSQYKKIAGQLEALGGQTITDAALKEAIALYNEHRAVLRDFSELAAEYPDRISPLQRNQVIKSGFFMTKPEHTALVRSIIAACRTFPVLPWKGSKVVLTGILADSEGLLNILAENAMAVAADEVAQESRQFRTDVPESADPFEAMALQIANMEGCSVLYDPEKKRTAMIIDMVKKHNAQGVVVVMTKFCDPEEFDYPILRAGLDKAGIPSVMIEVDQQMRGFEQARTSLQTFADMLS